jgi:hypothetical protein
MDANGILISLLHYPVYVLRPEERIGLWTQGSIIFLQNNKKTNNISTCRQTSNLQDSGKPRGVFKALTAYFMQNLYWFF